jgi:ribosome-interacting GTPase 1
MAHLSKIEVTSMQIKRIEKEIRDTPYHKGTEHHIGRLRARLARLREDLEGGGKSSGGGGVGYSVKKQGDATIILIGPPSAGKSTLINKLTNAQSKVAPYAFTTVSVIPGMTYYRGAKLQILDVPGLIEGAEEGKGRGREVLSVTRGADLIIVMTDVDRLDALENLENALMRNGIRPNQSPPNILIDKKLHGGLIIHSNIQQELSAETIKSVATEMGIKNAEITLKEKLSLDRLIDAFSRNRVYIPALYVVNKVDEQKKEKEISEYFNEAERGNFIIKISAEHGTGIEKLKEEIWEELNFALIYLVDPDAEPNLEQPMVVKKDMTIKEVGKLISSEFLENKKKAKIWGKGAKFPGQEVSLSTKILDQMQIRFI